MSKNRERQRLNKKLGQQANKPDYSVAGNDPTASAAIGNMIREQMLRAKRKSS